MWSAQRASPLFVVCTTNILVALLRTAPPYLDLTKTNGSPRGRSRPREEAAESDWRRKRRDEGDRGTDKTNDERSTVRFICMPAGPFCGGSPSLPAGAGRARLRRICQGRRPKRVKAFFPFISQTMSRVFASGVGDQKRKQQPG